MRERMGAKILHLSDIHFHSGSEAETDPDSIYRDKLMERVRDSAAKQAFDLIFVTGDIAGKGREDEYAVARAWLDRVATTARCGPAAVYVVPGNHDVDRTVTGGLEPLKLAQADVVNQQSPRAREARLRTLLADPMLGPTLFRHIEAYNGFAEHYQSEIGPTEAGRWMRQVALDHGYQLKIFGLNSVLFSSCKPPGGDDFPRQNLFLGPLQTTFRVADNEIGVVLIHHPPDWLTDNDAVHRRMKNDILLQFMGHKHSRDVDINASYVRFGAGAVNPDRYEGEFEPGFNIVTLGVEPTSKGHRLSVKAEVWTWQEDPGRFRLHQTQSGAELWQTSFPLKKVPDDAEPLPSADRAPPAAPDLGAGHGPHVQRFWSLSSSTKRVIAENLQLLTEDERRLPERYRYTNIFKRAAADGKLDALIDVIRTAGEK